MGWAKREAVNEDLVILGDGPENKKKAFGLLAAVKPDRRYKDNFNYELVQKDGSSIQLAGSASINRMIGEDDIGKFVKAEFFGWGQSGNGKFKQIEVQVWDGEVTAEMKAWPRWAELNNGAGMKRAYDVRPAADDDFRSSLDEEADDLPF